MEGKLRQTNMQFSREVRTANEKEVIENTARKLIREGQNNFAFSVERILTATQKELENEFVAHDLTYYVIKTINKLIIVNQQGRRINNYAICTMMEQPKDSIVEFNFH